MTIHVGIIGFGLSGSVFHAPIIETIKEFSLKTVVSSDANKVHQRYPHVSVVSDVDQLFSDAEIDLVVISSPNVTHYEYARKAIEAGKHVVVEKPFTVTSQEAEQLIALAKQHGVVLTVYQNRRWDNDFLTIQKLISGGTLGRLSVYEAHFDRYRPEVRNRWREKEGPGSGMLYDLGAHLIDQALTLFGKPKTIWADLRAEREGAEAIDYFHLVFGYDHMRVILHSGSLVRQQGPRFVLHGTKGSYIKFGMDPQEDQLRQGKAPGDLGWGEDKRELYGQLTTEIGGLTVESRVETVPGRYETFYQGVAEAIMIGKTAPVTAEEARDTIRMIEYALQSHQEGRVISVS
ncbi:oxidoreductase [Paenibacillus sediminis]|uniref:Scyllo-inositol 2-dehydrogenase (NADP+) n=1 Tax=Paenibacillus sediminis TaxID=664909 RepID=A0ABS4H2S8_9BACL|nr:oxidoreductase [Paenibacillus sediminis]MBP1936771.1 scyllo-inositol 2-dehydrogenase (NADP+) [Paenibacillus sediminis]